MLSEPAWPSWLLAGEAGRVAEDVVNRNQNPKSDPDNVALQLRRAISIRAEWKRLLENHAIAPSAARLCGTSLRPGDIRRLHTLDF